MQNFLLSGLISLLHTYLDRITESKFKHSLFPFSNDPQILWRSSYYKRRIIGVCTNGAWFLDHLLPDPQCHLTDDTFLFRQSQWADRGQESLPVLVNT